MGLDSIWIMPMGEDGEVLPLPEFDPPLDLITGMLFDNPLSFRGKTYNDLIESVTGVSLYQEEIPNNVVRDMAESLENWEAEKNLGDLGKLLDIDGNATKNLNEYDQLKRAFRTFADAGATLHGWW